MADRKVFTTFGWKVDNSGVAAVVASNNKVAKSVADISAQANRAHDTQKQANVAATVSYADAERAAKRVGLSVEELAARTGLNIEKQKQATVATRELAAGYDQVRRNADQAAAAQKKSSESSFGGIGGSDGKLSSGFGTVRAAGAAFANLGGGQGLTQIASFAGLGIELGVLGVAAGAGAIVLKALNEEQERATKVYAARLDMERSAAREVANLTTQGIQERIRAARQQLAIDQEVATQQLADAALYGIQVASNPLKQAAALAGLDPLYNAYNEAIAKNTVAIQGDQAALDVYTQSLTDGTTAVANAQAAADKLAETQVAAANLAIRADGMLREEREKRISQIARDLSLLSAQIASDELNSQAQRELGQQSAELYAEYSSLVSVTDSYADQLDRETKAKENLTDIADQYFEALDNESKALKDHTEAFKKLFDDLQASRDKVAQIVQDQRDKEAELWRKAGDDNIEAQAKNLADRRKQEIAYYKQVQDIQRRANATIANTTAARDALGAYLALQDKAEQLRKAKEDNEERAGELDKALEEQRRVIAKRLEEQLRTQRLAADKAIRAEYERARKEEEVNRQAIYKAYIALTDAQGASNALLQNYYAQALLYTRNFVNSATGEYARLVAKATQQSSATSATSGALGSLPINPYGGQSYTDHTGKTWVFNGRAWQPATAVRQYAMGTDYVPQTGIYELHKGEKVVPERENRGGGTLNMPMTFIGGNSASNEIAALKRDIRKAAEKHGFRVGGRD